MASASIEIIVYPCPTSNVLKIESSSYKGKPQIVVVNSVEGEYITTFDRNDNQTQLDVSKFSPGTYIITIFDQNGVKISQSRFVKR